MFFFDIPNETNLKPYAEKLQDLMENWENEVVEFKEAKSSYDTDKIGRYVSALSNEANLKRIQNGWLVFGVSETKDRHLVGTHYKEGPRLLLEKFKGEISKGTTGELTFSEIIELNLTAEGTVYRVLMFKVPAAATGIPTEWRGRAYARAGETTVPLQQDKIDLIRAQERYDWSRQIIPDSDISCLDPQAVHIAREKFKERLDDDIAAKEVDALSDEEFLTKAKLVMDGRLTNAALLLLGKEEKDYLFAVAPKLMWRLYGSNGDVRDYKIFSVPFITVVDKVFEQIRNLNYRYMPDQTTLFPQEVQQYDTWLLRELLNNCIAHSNYRLGGRIYVNESEDEIMISNPGEFIPKSIETVLQPEYNPPYYLNQLLAEVMMKFHMIDTSAMGIRRIYRIQQERYFPLPDYDFSIFNQVNVTVYGKILNDAYMHILFNRPDLDLQTVFLLDQVQKGKRLSKEAVAYLRKMKLVEGRATNLFLSSTVARAAEQEAQYIRNKGFDDQYYKDLIVQYLKEYGKAQKKDFRELLFDKLPDALSDQQKEYKLGNLLSSMKKQGVIQRDSTSLRNSSWILS